MIRQGCFAAVILFAYILSPRAALAQLPGEWRLVHSLPHWDVADMHFSDALHGMLLLDSNKYSACASLTTSDGGMTWILRRADSVGRRWPSEFRRSSHHSFGMPTAADAYEIAYGAGMYVTHDTGANWQYFRNVFDPNLSRGWLQMFSDRLGVAFTTHLSGQAVSVTRDSARHFEYPVVADYVDLRKIGDVLFVDTAHYWVSYSDGEMLHTSDGGVHWAADTVWKADSITQSFYNLLTIAETPRPERFFVLFTGKKEWWNDVRPYPAFGLDFMETRDGGNTWRIDSSIGGARVYKLCSPAPNRLWAFAGEAPSLYDLFGYTAYYGSDTLVYSPDDGVTWYRDTSVGHHLLEMEWPDEKHGYLVANEDSTLLVYRFVPNDEAVKTSRATRNESLTILESLASDQLTFASSVEGSSDIAIYDLLGRERFRGRQKIQAGEHVHLSINELPPGYYELVVRTANHAAFGKFVRQ